jgi:hypothetical protein
MKSPSFLVPDSWMLAFGLYLCGWGKQRDELMLAYAHTLKRCRLSGRALPEREAFQRGLVTA